MSKSCPLVISKGHHLMHNYLCPLLYSQRHIRKYKKKRACLKTMRVLLIDPPFFRFKGANSDIFPVGLGYIASTLEKHGHFARAYTAELFAKDEDSRVATLTTLMKNHKDYIKGLYDEKHYVWNEVKNILIKYSPDVVGLAAATTKFKSALKVAELAKKINPKVKVVIGGLHSTIKPEEVAGSKSVDAAVIGEGELTFLELVAAFEQKKPLHNIKGIAFRDGENIVKTSCRPLAENLDIFPFPGREVLIDEQKQLTKYDIIMCSRGCPYSCTFCNTTSIWGKKVRYHSIPAIVGQMRKIWLEEKTRVQFFDDTFTLNKEWLISLCKQIIDSEFNPGWSCLTRIDRIDEEMLDWMKKAGCKYMSIGVESGSQRVLDAIKKGITIEQINAAEKLLRKYNMKWGAFFMVGFPCETKEDMQETLKLMKTLDCTNIIFSIFTPYPGTEAFQEVERLHLLPESIDWEKFSHQSPDNYFCPNVPLQEFQKIVSEALIITDRRNTNIFDLMKRVYAKKRFFLIHPKTFLGKLLAVIKTRMGWPSFQKF